jgi:hypothetical protein
MSNSRFLSAVSLRLLGAAVAAAALVGPAETLSAQTSPKVYFACYVPLTGTVYRIKESTLKTACTASHVEFNWTDGADAMRSSDPAGGDLTGVLSNANVVKLLGRALSTTPPQPGQVLTWNGSAWIATTPAVGGGSADHGALTGLGDDDHPQYLLTNGVRSAVNGFAVTGVQSSGSIPTSGSGIRLMWYPGKAAFRVGQTGTEWDDAKIGHWSFATGLQNTANGEAATAMGEFSVASGENSVAIGYLNTASAQTSTAIGYNNGASGQSSTALGFTTRATGFASTAMGQQTVASGNNSTAMGTFASTDSHVGSFVYGDASTFGPVINAVTNNEFVVRAQHIWLGTNNAVSNPAGHFLTTSTGAFLSTGGAWTNSSDVALKDDFEDVSAEVVLSKIASMPVRQWSYKAEGSRARQSGASRQQHGVAREARTPGGRAQALMATGFIAAAVVRRRRRRIP